MLAEGTDFIDRISKLPDGKVTLSTASGFALSETEILQEFRPKHPYMLVSDMMYRIKHWNTKREGATHFQDTTISAR